MSTRRLLRIEREARFEAARGTLIARLGQAHRDDGWFRTPGVVGRWRGRDVEVRFPGGADARLVRVAVRVRTGGAFRARPRGRLLRWAGMNPVACTGDVPGQPIRFAVERLVLDHGALRVLSGDGLVRVDLPWDPAAPDPERALKALDRLDRLALDLEEVATPRLESGGVLTCPFCRDPIAAESPVARCAACGTPYHPSCFEESGGCAIYGCKHRLARTSSGSFPAVDLKALPPGDG
jgi:hypothetical protein